MTSRRAGTVSSTIANIVVALVLAAIGLWLFLAMLHAASEPLPPCTPTSMTVCEGPPVDHTENRAP